MHEGVTTTLIVIGQGDKLALSLSAELCDSYLATVSIDESTVVTKNARRHGHTPKMHTKNLSMLLVVGRHGASVYE
jgi:hypothetical protein